MLGRNSGVVGGKTPLRDLQGRHKMSDIMHDKENHEDNNADGTQEESDC